MTEPGQPWVMISGSAFSCFDSTWMKWMSSPSISVVNCGQRVQPRLDPAPVVLGRPVARERLHRRQLHALRRIGDELLAWPARRVDAPAQVSDLLVRNLDAEGANLGCDFDGLIPVSFRSAQRPGRGPSSEDGSRDTSAPLSGHWVPGERRAVAPGSRPWRPWSSPGCVRSSTGDSGFEQAHREVGRALSARAERWREPRRRGLTTHHKMIYSSEATKLKYIEHGRPRSTRPYCSRTQSQPAHRVLFISCMSLFMVGLDITVVNVALPSIGRDLHSASPDCSGRSMPTPW